MVAPLLNREFQKSFFHEPMPGVRKASSYVIRYFLRRLSDLVAQGHSAGLQVNYVAPQPNTHGIGTHYSFE